MGVFDRLKSLLRPSDADADDSEPRVSAAFAVDEAEIRRAQLAELDDALRSLARAMGAEDALMSNPGWRGRVEDLRFAAGEAARLQREGFDRPALQDLAAEVRPLYGGADVPEEYAAYQTEHDRVMAAVRALRSSMGEA